MSVIEVLAKLILQSGSVSELDKLHEIISIPCVKRAMLTDDSRRLLMKLILSSRDET
jgi:hypothetical protein